MWEYVGINNLGLKKGGKLCSWEDKGGELWKSVISIFYQPIPRTLRNLRHPRSFLIVRSFTHFISYFLISTIKYVVRSNLREERFWLMV